MHMEAQGTDAVLGTPGRRSRAARLVAAVVAAALWTPAPAAAQQRFEDVVRNLRNPDPKVRLASVRLLREARYPEAVVPLAALVTDPVDQVQLEAIGAELSFFLAQDVPARRRLGFLVEVRNRGGAAGAFEQGRLAVSPRPVPAEVLTALLKAVDDETARVRLEAIYAAATIARAPLPGEVAQLLTKALDHYDPAVRGGAARLAGRAQASGTAETLIKLINDSNADVRYAAMRAVGQLREERAIGTLTEQLKFYRKGEGAWSALDALAHIAHPSSVPVFTEWLTDRDPYLRRAAAEGVGRTGNKSAMATLETGAGNDSSPMVRAAMAYALQKMGRNYVPRLIEFLDDPATRVQVQEYLLDLGAPVEKDLIPSLQEPDSSIRAAVADVLGEIGGDASLTALQALQDRDAGVVAAATRAVERIKLRRAS